MTLEEALTHLRAIVGLRATSASEAGLSTISCEALTLLLDQFLPKEFSRPLTLGLLVKDESGDTWVLVSIRATKSNANEYRFVNSVNDYKYRATSPQTLVNKFPRLKEFL